MSKESELELYRRSMDFNKENKDVSPMVDEEGLPKPISPSSSMGRMDEDTARRLSTISENGVDDKDFVEIEFSFFKCESCDEWTNGENTFLVEANQPVEIKDEEEGDIKTLKTEIQSWCSECILDVICKIKDGKNRNVIDAIEQEIKELKEKRLKITRIQDKHKKVD